jgi:hypothetical protein
VLLASLATEQHQGYQHKTTGLVLVPQNLWTNPRCGATATSPVSTVGTLSSWNHVLAKAHSTCSRSQMADAIQGLRLHKPVLAHRRTTILLPPAAGTPQDGDTRRIGAGGSAMCYSAAAGPPGCWPFPRPDLSAPAAMPPHAQSHAAAGCKAGAVGGPGNNPNQAVHTAHCYHPPSNHPNPHPLQHPQSHIALPCRGPLSDT